MSSTDKSFTEILELFEANGWKLQGIRGRYRDFTKAGRNLWQFPVENGKVKAEYVEKIRQFFKEEQSLGRIPN